MKKCANVSSEALSVIFKYEYWAKECHVRKTACVISSVFFFQLW